MQLESGSLSHIDTQGTGWVIGFSDWTLDGNFDLRHIAPNTPMRGPYMKWFNHPPGHPNGEEKPISVGRTMSVLVSPQSEFRLDFSEEPLFQPDRTRSVCLRNHGDYALWGAGVYHRAFGLSHACILTLRWEPMV